MMILNWVRCELHPDTTLHFTLTHLKPLNVIKFWLQLILIGHVIPTMQFFAGISRNTQSKPYMLSLTECVWDFHNNALSDTHCHALLLFRLFLLLVPLPLLADIPTFAFYWRFHTCSFKTLTHYNFQQFFLKELLWKYLRIYKTVGKMVAVVDFYPLLICSFSFGARGF